MDNDQTSTGIGGKTHHQCRSIVRTVSTGVFHILFYVCPRKMLKKTSNKTISRLEFHRFSHDFHRFSMIFIDFPIGFSIDWIFHRFSDVFPWFSPWLSDVACGTTLGSGRLPRLTATAMDTGSRPCRGWEIVVKTDMVILMVDDDG